MPVMKLQKDVPPCGLSDLPNEILSEIINSDLLGVVELYCLSVLSKRLQEISLPIYLASFGIKDPASSINISTDSADPPDGSIASRLGPLSGLAISTSLQSVQSLTCIFPTQCIVEDNRSLQRLHQKVYQLCRVIRRLNFVSDVIICLDWKVAGFDDGRLISDAVLQRWSDCMGQLLNSIIEKDCTLLRVQYGSRLKDSYNFHPLNPSRVPFSQLTQFIRQNFQTGGDRTFLKGPGWEFRRATSATKGYSKCIVTKLSPEAARACILHSFAINSPIMLLPPVSHWTFSLLYSSSTITSLSFGKIRLKPKVWGIVLPMIAEAVCDQLKEVSFKGTCWGIHTDHILQFLCSMKQLETLEVHHIFDSGISASNNEVAFGGRGNPLPVPRLLHLRNLHAPYDFVNHLLPSEPPSSTLPNLRTWTAYLFRSINVHMDFLHATQIHAFLCQKLWSSNIHILEPKCVELSINMEGYFHSSAIVAERVSVLADKHDERSAAFEHVTCVYLCGFIFLMDDCEILCRWLALAFPALRRLSIKPERLDEQEFDDGFIRSRYPTISCK
ncbi:hypothetical protein B0H34DRAFT_727606 [Crassisporium funariophilum]|nr:hypothetical protein B0H34DRAFT_727606 [Crassisporium funariophilum]